MEAHGEEEKYRSSFRRDYARVIHSAAFRRLQGKTQLFPGIESDYFRNRLTHSLEAAQISRSIAVRLNHIEKFLAQPENAIDPDVPEAAALCHDLGHPPFGHNGERALDERMKEFGGFEGNAQTLRILARLEKRENPSKDSAGFLGPIDDRCGLNLTARVLGSTLKYDNQIAFQRKSTDPLAKGYYETEATVVDWLKSKVLNGEVFDGDFKTIECQIMDIADDIAYSTYDLEDALKAGFIIPLDLATASPEIVEKVAAEVAAALQVAFTADQAQAVLSDIVRDITEAEGEKPGDIARLAYQSSLEVSKSGYLRVEFTSQLVREFIQGVHFVPNEKVPPLSKVELAPKVREKVEVLKRFNYVSLIMSPRLKIAEFRGGEIVQTIFDTLAKKDGHRLLPDDFQRAFERIAEDHRKRVICDFIAGMTDRYALEFYGRLRSENPQTIFKPL